MTENGKAICLVHTERTAQYQLGNTQISISIKHQKKAILHDILCDYAVRNFRIISQ